MESDTGQIRRARRAEAALVVLAVIAVIAALKLAQDFFIPVVVGIFGAYSLRPIVDKLCDWKLPEPLAAAVVMVALLLCVVGGCYGLRNQAANAVAELPQAAHTIRVRVSSMLNRPGPSPLAHVKEAAAELKKAARDVSGEPAQAPAPGVDILDRLASNGINALGVLTTLGVGLAIMIFLLAAGNSFRRKLLHVAGNTFGERRIAVEILDEIDHQVQRYLLVMLMTNAVLGFALWGVYLLFGLESAAFWAFCVAVLHFIPYLGVVFALVMIGAVAFLQFGAAGVVFGVVFATAIASVAIGLFLQNWLQGRASKMNPVAVFVSVLFFGWLWGGWGLLLGAPLIAIVRTIAGRVAGLAALNEFLSTDGRKKASLTTPS